MIVLDKIFQFFFFFTIFLITTWAGILHVGSNKIGIAAPDLWILACIILYLSLKKLTGYNFSVNLLISKALNFLSNRNSFIKVLLFFSISILIAHLFKQWSISVDGADQSFVHHSLLQAFNDPILQCTICNSQTYMGEHTSYTLLLVAPIFSIFKTNELIFIFEIFLIFSSIVLLFQSELRDKKNLWPYALFIILCQRSLRYSMIWDFREDHIAFFFISLALLSMRKKSLPSYIFSITGVLLSKENFPFLIPFLSIPIFFETSFKFSKKDKIIWATTSILLSAIWFIMIQKVIHPYYTGGVAKNHVVSRFPGFGETNTEVIYNLLFVPKYWLKLLSERVLNLSTFKYLILLLAPYFVLIYRRWYWILASTPIIAMNVLSYANTQRMMIFHYELVILPLLIYPVLLTLKEYEWNNHKKKWKVALLVGVAFSGKWPAYYIWEYFPSKNEFQSIAFFKDIEDDGNNIATSMRLLAQITHIKHQKVIHYQSDLTLDKVINYEHNRNNRFNRLPITRILFDLSKPKEKLLYYEAKLEGWKEYKRAPATQFVILKREL